MIPPSSAETHLCTNLEKMGIEARTLMHLPVEVRLIIYKYLFGNSGPIKLDINNAGYVSFTNLAKLSLSSLRTCKTFYLEAGPVLYGINTFTIMFKDVRRLAKMRQGSRMCIENLIIESVRQLVEQTRPPRIPLQPGIFANPLVLPTPPFQARRPRTDAPPREVLDLATIGAVLSGLQNLLVKPSAASPLLAIVLQLSRSLPCSPIRDWPVLEVLVHIKDFHDEDYAPGNGLCLTEEHLELITTNRRLSALTETSTLGLGHEMPDLKTIRVEGCLTWDHCQLIEDHKSSFGDCSFEKEVINNSMAQDNKDPKFKYTWRRVDEDEQQAKTRNAAVNMHQWVPRLTKEDYLTVLASFGAELEAV